LISISFTQFPSDKLINCQLKEFDLLFLAQSNANDLSLQVQNIDSQHFVATFHSCKADSIKDFQNAKATVLDLGKVVACCWYLGGELGVNQLHQVEWAGMVHL